MAGLSTGFKKKLSISPCDLEENGNVRAVRSSDSFELMLNPSKYNLDKSVCFTRSTTVGQVGSDNKFRAIEPESLSFDFVIDGTGVVNLPIPGVGSDDVTKQLEDLSKVVYRYNGKNHEPNVVQVLWGKLIFVGRLTSMNSEYTLFKPSGDPLRAKVSLAFKSYMSPKEEALRKNNSSPDLSHRVIFQKGDTLPLLCFRIYKDCAYYSEVARYNNIINFRDIEPGTEIAFPPLR
jgi:hypothetical protein